MHCYPCSISTRASQAAAWSISPLVRSSRNGELLHSAILEWNPTGSRRYWFQLKRTILLLFELGCCVFLIVLMLRSNYFALAVPALISIMGLINHKLASQFEWGHPAQRL